MGKHPEPEELLRDEFGTDVVEVNGEREVEVLCFIPRNVGYAVRRVGEAESEKSKAEGLAEAVAGLIEDVDYGRREVWMHYWREYDLESLKSVWVQVSEPARNNTEAIGDYLEVF